MFKRWAVAGLIPAVVLGSLATVAGMGHDAQAQAPSATTQTGGISAGQGELLPHGVHRKESGRYVKDVCDHGKRRCMAQFFLPEDWKPGMEVPKYPEATSPEAAAQPMAPKDVLAAYSIPAASASNGKIVAIVDLPDSNALTEVNGYRTHNGIPTLQRCAGMPTGTGAACFAQVNYDGTPSTMTDPQPGEDGEADLDMAMITAACPDCSILLVELKSSLDITCEPDYAMAVATAAKLHASATSISIGGPEFTDPNLLALENATDAGPPDPTAPCAFEDSWVYDSAGPFSSPGNLVFAASGDFGYLLGNQGFSATVGGASPSWPSSSPFIVSVGGTALYLSGTSTYGEGVWDGAHFGLDEGTQATSIYQDVTTSGCSTEFGMPPWQTTVLAGTGCNFRGTADISAAATFFSGGTETAIGVYFTNSGVGTYGGFVGTSASSPLVAAIFARLNLTTSASNDLGFMYENPTAFNDVGSSGYKVPTGGKLVDAPASSTCVTSKNKLCTAAAGWDGPTGLGSPNGAALALLSTTAPAKPYPDSGVPVESVGDGGSFGSDSGDDSGSTGDDSGSTGDDSGTVLTGDDSGTLTPNPDASTTLDGSAAGDAGSGGSSSSSGCSCTAAGSSPMSGGFALLGAAIGLAGFGARRRRNRGE